MSNSVKEHRKVGAFLAGVMLSGFIVPQVARQLFDRHDIRALWFIIALDMIGGLIAVLVCWIDEKRQW